MYADTAIWSFVLTIEVDAAVTTRVPLRIDLPLIPENRTRNGTGGELMGKMAVDTVTDTVPSVFCSYAVTLELTRDCTPHQPHGPLFAEDIHFCQTAKALFHAGVGK